MDWASGKTGSDRLGDILPQRQLIRNGEKVTAFSLGGYHLGLTEVPAEAQQMIERSLELGIRFFDNARGYNKGRSEAVWNTLNAYGFQRTSDNKFEDEVIPDSCFEYFVRQQVKDSDNILDSGEIAGYEIADLANRIRSSRQMDDNLDGPERTRIHLALSNMQGM